MKKLILPESKAVKEVRGWRRSLEKRAATIGWDKYLAQINERPSLFGERCVTVVRERPAKRYGH